MIAAASHNHHFMINVIDNMSYSGVKPSAEYNL